MDQKNENRKKIMAKNIGEELLPIFKGLSESSASKMISSIEKKALSLSKRFFKLQASDCKRILKMEKELIKKQKKAIKKSEIRAKIAKIIATDKPVALISLPEPKKPAIKRHAKPSAKQVQ
jgi:Mg2+ and Co2+ transporter CorA